MRIQPHFRSRLGDDFRRVDGARDLTCDGPLYHTAPLLSPNDVHDLFPLERSSCRFKGKAAQYRFDQPFAEAMACSTIVLRYFTCHSLEEPFCRIACRTQPEFGGVPLRVRRPKEVHPVLLTSPRPYRRARRQ
jgi:hypothetical protein